MLVTMLFLSLFVYADDAEIDRKMRTVKVFRQSDPPDSCKEIGEVTAARIEVLPPSVREDVLRRTASQKGANGIVYRDIKSDPMVATIYKCK